MKFQYIRYAGRGQRRSGCRQRANSSPHRDNGTDLKVELRTTLVLKRQKGRNRLRGRQNDVAAVQLRQQIQSPGSRRAR